MLSFQPTGSSRPAIVLALVVGAHAGYTGLNPNRATGMRASQQVPYGMRIPSPISDPQQQQPYAQAFLNDRPSGLSTMSAGAIRGAEASAPRQVVQAKAASVPVVLAGGATQNVFGAAVQNCGESECVYTGDSPEICVSIENILIPQCISVWNLKEGVFKKRLASRQGMGNLEIIPQCGAMPSAVLQSEFSKEMWDSCYIESREYKYVSPSSSKYKGASGTSTVTNEDLFMIGKPSLGEERPKRLSAKCQRFRGVIESVCNMCGEQAADESSKGALGGMCEGLIGAPAELAETRPDVGSGTVAVLTGLAAVSALVLAVRRRGASAVAQEPLLG